MASRTELDLYKRRSITAAKELCYSKDVIALLKAAKTENEIERIMVDARKGRI